LPRVPQIANVADPQRIGGDFPHRVLSDGSLRILAARTLPHGSQIATLTRMNESLTSIPNLLSLSRVPLGVVLFALISEQLWAAALGVFIVATITDWLDGWWARRFNQTSQVGRSLDPLTDKFLICGAFIYLQSAKVGVLPWMVTAIVGREILITGIRGIVEATGKKFGADWFGKLKTALQCAVLIAILTLRTLQTHSLSIGVPMAWLELVTKVLLFAMLFATIGSGLQYLVKAARLLRTT
jgi:CDP-diacylglycerol---glycerol-3-phosphate 3-phosphatidyltransferase